MASAGVQRAVRLAAAVLAVTLALPAAAAHVSDVPGSVASPAIAPGESFRLVIDAPGAYAYFCHPHPWMKGRLVVEAGSSDMAPVERRILILDDGEPGGANARFVDAASGGAVTTLHAGDTVVWVNQGNLTHDVHLSTASNPDNGTFETVVLVGLAVTLVVIFLVSRRA